MANDTSTVLMEPFFTNSLTRLQCPFLDIPCRGVIVSIEQQTTAQHIQRRNMTDGD